MFVFNFVEMENNQLKFCIHFRYLCDFVVRDIKIAVHLESPRKIDFNFVNDFFSK